jgi:hypothetical protein
MLNKGNYYQSCPHFVRKTLINVLYPLQKKTLDII